MAEESNPFRISSVEGPHGKGIRLEFDVESDPSGVVDLYAVAVPSFRATKDVTIERSDDFEIRSNP